MAEEHTPSAEKQFSVAVIGGGIAGLCLAIGLIRINVPFHLYEAAHQFAEIGAGVGFGRNARLAMTLIEPRIKAGFDKGMTCNSSPDHKDTWYQFRMGMDGRGDAAHLKAGQKFARLNRPGCGLHSVHRAHFLDELVKLLPEEFVTFGKKTTRVEDCGEGGVKIYFEDGTSAEASAVVGCDGVKSHVRDSILGPEMRPVFSGKYAYRGILDMDKAAGLLGDEVARNSHIHAGYHGHVVTFPIERGKAMNVVAFRTKADGEWEDERWVVPMNRAEMEEDFADWGSDVKKLLSIVEKPDVWALFNHPPASTYFKGRVCLMGDAAHASTPHQGAGAGMAVEDAYVLSSVLGLVRETSQLNAAFSAYDATRRPRTTDLVRTSRDAGNHWEFEAEGIKDNIERYQQRLDERMIWIWDEDVEAEFKNAANLFQEACKKLRVKQ